MTLHLVTILLRTSQQLFQFHYDQFKDADKIVKNYEEADIGILSVEDDYGSKAAIILTEIAGIILTDLDREMVAQEAVEWAKVQKDIKLQKKIQESPGARILQPPSGLRA